MTQGNARLTEGLARSSGGFKCRLGSGGNEGLDALPDAMDSDRLLLYLELETGS